MSDVTLPYTLTPGATENVSHVQANDEALRDHINSNSWIDATKYEAGSVYHTALATTTNGLAHGSFSAYRNAAYSPTGAAAKVPYDVEEWDYGSYFDVTTNIGRFTPLVAGIYRLSAFQRVLLDSYIFVYVYKNGALHRVLDGDYPSGQAAGSDTSGVGTASGSALVSANGSTDYFEIYAQHGEAGTVAFSTGATLSYFQGELVGKI